MAKYILDGQTFKTLVTNGCQSLINDIDRINALNVFPVPDGDTGTNMRMTIEGGVKAILAIDTNSIGEMSKKLSRAMTMSARGNSGVILSQFFKGLSLGLEGKDAVNAEELAIAFDCGVKQAYKVVQKPTEGTMLTVMREATEVANKNSATFESIEDFFACFIKEAHASLDRTPELLPVLKEAGVIDSGGAGYNRIIEGMIAALDGNILVEQEKYEQEAKASMGHFDANSILEFGYCTEFILQLQNAKVNIETFDISVIVNFLETIGDSIVAFKDEDIVKVHVHTLHPGVVLTYAQQFGEFVKLKIENMSEQHTELVDKGADPLKGDKPKEMAEYAIIAVAAGSGIEEKFKQYGATYIVSGGQTMNPSTEDFYAAIKHVNAKKVFLLPNNSNIVMAAKQACEVTDEGVEARVIETKTIPQGLVACMMFNPEASFDDNEEGMKEGITSVKTGQVTFAIKDTNIDGVEVRKDEYIALHGKSIVCCNPSKVEATKIMLDGMIDEMSSIVTLLVGEGATEEEVNGITSYIEKKFSDVEVEVVEGKQPVYSFIIGVE